MKRLFIKNILKELNEINARKDVAIVFDDDFKKYGSVQNIFHKKGINIVVFLLDKTNSP